MAKGRRLYHRGKKAQKLSSATPQVYSCDDVDSDSDSDSSDEEIEEEDVCNNWNDEEPPPLLRRRVSTKKNLKRGKRLHKTRASKSINQSRTSHRAGVIVDLDFDDGLDTSSNEANTTDTATVYQSTDRISDAFPSEEYILSFGLQKVGFSERRQQRVVHKKNIERFLAHYGPPPKVVLNIYKDLKEVIPSIKLTYLLLTLNWFKVRTLSFIVN